MHDLTLPNTGAPISLTTIIGLGLKYIPTPRHPNRNPKAFFGRFKKYFHTEVFFSGCPLISEEIYNPKLHVLSEWMPKPWDIPNEIHNRTNSFRRQMLRLLRVKRTKTTNLLPFQTRALSTLALRTDILVTNCDKNLGHALINTSTYVNRTFEDHLDNEKVYKRLTDDEATTHMDGVATQVRIWLKNIQQAQNKGQDLGNKRYLT